MAIGGDLGAFILLEVSTAVTIGGGGGSGVGGGGAGGGGSGGCGCGWDLHDTSRYQQVPDNAE